MFDVYFFNVLLVALLCSLGGYWYGKRRSDETYQHIVAALVMRRSDVKTSVTNDLNVH